MKDIIFDIITILVFGIIIIRYINTIKLLKKIDKIDNKEILSGCEIAKKILEKNNLEDIYIVKTKNPFEEGYKEERNVLKLSKENFDSSSITNTLIISRESMKVVLQKKDTKVKISNNILKITNILILLNYILIIACSILRDVYYLKLSVISLICIILIRLICINSEKKISDLALEEINKMKLVDEQYNEEIKEVTNELTSYFLLYPITIIITLIKLINFNKS